ncbi:MAG TPA: MFS transporter [Bacteroidota bacterium]|nr:MFS transporter [Bacteroidota bacterium]
MDEQPSTTHSFWHPSQRPYRYVVLLTVSLLTFGSYFAYDSVGAIAPTLIAALGVGREAIGQMYTLYSVAAILSVFIGGLLIDKIGTRRASLLFSLLVTIGAAIVAVAPNIWILNGGRFIFGWGSESLVVAQSAIFTRWFKGKELAFSFGVGLTVSRLGTLFSFNTEALIAEYFNNYKTALWAAVVFCAISVGANLLFILLDKRGEKVLGLKEEGGGDKIVLADVKKFNPSYWYVTLLCVTFYSAIFPFTALSTDFFNSKWGIPMTAGAEGGFLYQVFYNVIHMFSTAGGTTTIIIFASMVFAPFFGQWVDRFGRRATVMVIGSVFMIPAFLSMAFTMIPPAFPMIILGGAFVMVPAAMWPSIPLIVEENRVGTAFGLTTMIQNFGLALFPWLNGLLRDSTQAYTASMIMFSLLGIIGLVFALLLRKSETGANAHGLETIKTK